MSSRSTSKKGRGRPLSDERAAAAAFLADGGFHPVSEVLDVMMSAVDPNRAMSVFRREPRTTNKTLLTLDDKVNSGKRTLAFKGINRYGFEVINEDGKNVKVSTKANISKLQVRLRTDEEFLAAWDTEARTQASRKSAERMLAERVSVMSDEEALVQKSLAAKVATITRELGKSGEGREILGEYYSKIFYVYRTSANARTEETGYLVKTPAGKYVVFVIWPEPTNPEIYDSARELADSPWRFVVQ